MKTLARFWVLIALICSPVLWPQPTSAQLLLTGVGGSGAAVPIVLNGNLVTPEFSPVTAAAQIPSSPFMVLSYWFYCASGTTTVTPDRYQSCNNVGGIGNFLDSAGDAEHQAGFNFIFNDSAASGGVARFNFGNSPAANNGSNASYTGMNVLATGWHHMLVYADVSCTSATNVRCGGVYLDGVQIVSGLPDRDVGGWTGTKTISFATNPFYVNVTNGSEAPGKFGIAQVYLDTTASPVVAGTNTLNFSISKFYSAGPVNFGANCAGPLGGLGPSAFCLSNGPATFLTNASGAVGKATFTQTANATNTVTNIAYATPYSPGETPDRPYVRWTNSATWNGGCIEAVKTCTTALASAPGGNIGNITSTGDLLCATIVTTGANTTYNDAFIAPTGGGVATWTDELGGTAQNNVNNNLALFCGTVTTPTAAGGNLPILTWTWTNANGGGFSRAAITLTDFGKPGGTPSIAAAAATNSTISATTLPCPSVTAPAGLSLWVCFHTAFDWAFASPTTGIGPASTSTLLGKLPSNVGGGNTPMLEFEKIGAAGAVTRTAQGNPGNKSLAAAMVLN